MLKSDHSIYILDKMFKPVAEGENAKVLDFDGIVGDNIYIGLFTKNPKSDFSAYEGGEFYLEPGPKFKETFPEYCRIQLNTDSRIKEVPFLSRAEFKTASVPAPEKFGDSVFDSVTCAYIRNADMILFPEANNNWGTIVGFGLFYSNDTKSGELPFLWGTVGDAEGIEVRQGQVPVIREKGLEITMY